MVDVQLRGLAVTGEVVLGTVVYGPAARYLYALLVEEQTQTRGKVGDWPVQRTSNPLRSPPASSISVSTFSTEACWGPSSHQRSISLTLSEGPSKTASTLPSGRFLTHPARFSSTAFCLVESRKKTPWTWPDIRTWARSRSLLCTSPTSVGNLA